MPPFAMHHSAKLILLTTLAGLPFTARAASFTWGGGNSSWTDTSASGWNGGPPASGDTASIPSGTVAATTNNQQGGVAITVSGTAVLRSGGYYLTPGNLTLSNGGTVSLQNTGHYANYGGGWLTATLTVSGSSASGSLMTGDQDHAFWNLTHGTVFDVADVTGNADPDLTISAGLKDAVGSPDTTWVPSGIVKSGAGTMVLSAVNTYSGGTTVSGGRLILATGNASGTGRIQDALTINDSATVETTGDATGLGWLDQISSVAIHGGTLTSTGTMHIWNIPGGISMTGGLLQSNNGASDPNGTQLEWNRTSVTTHASADTATIAGRIRMRPDGGYTGITFTVNDGAAATDLLVSAAITEVWGSLGITKSGAGNLVLTGNNSYSGGTVVGGGTLSVGTLGNIGSAWLALDNTSTLRYTGTGSETTSRDLWINNAAGTRTFDIVDSGAVLTLSGGGGQINRAIAKAGAGTLVLGKVVSGSESVTVNGGTLVLAATNSHTGGTTINAGTLKAAADQALGGASSTLTVNGGTLDLDGHAQTLAALTGSSGLVQGGSGAISVLTIGNGNASSSFGGTLTGKLALVKTGTGTLTLTGPVETTAFITVEQGTLDLSTATLSTGVRINASPQAVLKLPSATIGKLYLDNAKLSPGRWGAPGSVAAGLADFESPVFSGPGVATIADTGLSSRERWKTMKHGLFVHYVWDGSGGVTHNADGSSPTSVNDVADRFDAAGFANDLESMGVEYVIFTAWHSLFYPLFNSSAMERYHPGRCPNRDMIGDMITAVRAKGIRVLLYTHPMQPISWDYNTHNNLINDVHAELVERYGDQIEGLFLDENDVNGNQDSFVDYPRLVGTIRHRNPELVLIQNYTGNVYSCDLIHWETGNPRQDYKNNPDATWTTPTPTTQLLTQNWSALQPKVPTPAAAIWRSAEGIFRTSVVGAGSSTMGGGWLWAAGPYPGDGTWFNPSTGQTQNIGRWEQGVLEAMQGAAAYLAPIAVSVKNTYPSTSWLTKPYTHITALPYGIVATRSTDGTKEYIHVLNPPGTKTLTLPAPADGKVFTNARLLKNSRAVTLARTSRSLSLTLGSLDNWETLNTVIVMDVVTPGARGLTNNNSSNVTYSGASWAYQNNRNAGEFQDDIHYATTNGDSVTLAFDGTDVGFLSTYGPNRGQVDVYLDDVFQETIDLFDADTFNATVFSRSGLPRGQHTLKLVKTSGQYLTVDAFNVTEWIDSNDASLAYSGTWSNQASSDAIGGSVRKATDNGSSVTLNFEGNGIDFISSKGIGGATVKVHLNDAYMTDVPQSALSPQSQAVAFSSFNAQALANGANKLTVMKNRGTWMDVDAFRVYKGSASTALRWGASGGGGSATWNVNNNVNWFDGIAATKWEDFGGTDYAATFEGTAGTVTLGANVKANRLTFNTSGYLIRSTNAANLLTLNGTTATLTTATGVSATISSAIAGGAGMVKDGPGTLALTSTTSSRTGPTAVRAGTLSLGNGSSNAKLADSSSVNISSGATLNLNHTGTDTVNALSFAGIARPPGIYSAANSSFITGTGTLTVSTGPATDYDGWASFHGITGAQSGDDDHDGHSNHFEYTFGQNPKVPSGNPVTFLSTTTGPHLTYTRRKPSLTGLTHRVMTSTDLSGWTEDPTATQTVTATNGDLETVQVTLSAPLLSETKLFIRISAVTP
jgi:autotransporter-associated beta strand protein